MSSQRMHFMGSAGFDFQSKDEAVKHEKELVLIEVLDKEDIDDDILRFTDIFAAQFDQIVKAMEERGVLDVDFDEQEA